MGVFDCLVSSMLFIQLFLISRRHFLIGRMVILMSRSKLWSALCRKCGRLVLTVHSDLCRDRLVLRGSDV